MRKIKFDDFIAEQTSETSEAKIDWETKKEEWLISVNSFFKEMEGLLEKYISENKVSIAYDSKNLIEDYVGE